MPLTQEKKRQIVITLGLIGAFYVWWWLLAPANKGFRTRRPPSVEGRILLASLYTGEKSYKAEMGKYTPNLPDTGVAPEGARRYVVGFSEKCRRNEDEVLNSSQYPPSVYARNKSSFAVDRAELEKIQLKFTELPCHPRFPQEWEAYAVGEIGGDQLDIWRITDKKELSQTQAGDPSRNAERSGLMVFGAHVVAIVVLIALSLIWTKLRRARIAWYIKGPLEISLALATFFVFLMGSLLSM